MNCKKIISWMLLLSFAQFGVLCGCESSLSESSSKTESSAVTVVDKNSETLAVFESQDSVDVVAEGSEVYVKRALKDAVQIIQNAEKCTSEEAQEKLFSKEYVVHTAYDPLVYDAIHSQYQQSSIGLASFGCAVTDLKGNVCALYSAGENSETTDYSTTLLPPYSAFKPLSVYAQAVEAGLIGWSTVYEDSPYKTMVDENGEESGWPVNATQTYANANIPVYHAIAQSLNTIAVKCLKDVGVRKSIDFLMDNFGIDLSYEQNKATTEGEEEVIGNIALGYLNKGVSPLDMAGYYQIFAAKGVYKAPCTVVKICTADSKVAYKNQTEEKQVIKESTAGIMNMLLQGVVKIGTGKAAYNSEITFAGKTGTGNSDDGNWFVGVAPEYSCAVWHGAGAEANSCAQLFGAIMAQLCGESKKIFELPQDLTMSIYCMESGKSAGTECSRIDMGYYAAGEVPEICDAHK